MAGWLNLRFSWGELVSIARVLDSGQQNTYQWEARKWWLKQGMTVISHQQIGTHYLLKWFSTLKLRAVRLCELHMGNIGPRRVISLGILLGWLYSLLLWISGWGVLVGFFFFFLPTANPTPKVSWLFIIECSRKQQVKIFRCWVGGQGKDRRGRQVFHLSHQCLRYYHLKKKKKGIILFYPLSLEKNRPLVWIFSF